MKRILLLICGEGADSAAVEWTLRLAGLSSSAVTALAIVPTMVRDLSGMEPDPAALMATDTTLGMYLQKVVRRLSACGIDGVLRLRQGAPDRQVAREVVEGNHDLVIAAAKPCRWWLRQLEGDPICSMLRWVDRPLLLAAPTGPKEPVAVGISLQRCRRALQDRLQEPSRSDGLRSQRAGPSHSPGWADRSLSEWAIVVDR